MPLLGSNTRTHSTLVAVLAGLFACAISGVPNAADQPTVQASRPSDATKGASRTSSSRIQYPDFATAASPAVLGEFNGVKDYGAVFGSAHALYPRAPGYI